MKIDNAAYHIILWDPTTLVQFQDEESTLWQKWYFGKKWFTFVVNIRWQLSYWILDWMWSTLSVYFFTTNFSIKAPPPTHIHTHTHTSSTKDFHFRFPDHNCSYVNPIGFYFILNSRSKIKNVLSCFTIWRRIPPQNTVCLLYASKVSKVEENILLCIKN